MSTKVTTRLYRALMEISEAPSSKFSGANTGKTPIRCLGTCGTLVARRATLPVSQSAAPTVAPHRSFINLAAPVSSRRMEYCECRTLEYTPEQMYNVVASVDQYQQFVPWCKKSRVAKARNGSVRAELEIGFPPIVERYTSEVTVVPNHQVRAVCTNGSLFSHLETIWRFAPGVVGQRSCKVEFCVSFEFRSVLHSQLAAVFFDEVVKKMVGAFELRAAKLYGSQPAPPLRRRCT